MPKSFSILEKELIREKLLLEGNRLFSIYGLKKTNVEEIALGSGISKGAFYLFFPSKEVLFFEVTGQAEKKFRQEILSVIDLEGPSPRIRLYTALRKAYFLWQTIPLLTQFSKTDFEVIARRVPGEIIEAHMNDDRLFVEELLQHCQSAGIMIKADPGEIRDMLYTIFICVLHQNDFGEGQLEKSIDTLIWIISGYFMGEIDLPQIKEKE